MRHLNKQKEKKVDFLKRWGITDKNKLKAGFSWLRYKNPPEKGIYWYFISLYIRHRDVKEYGTCISCNRPISIETCDAGHFMPAKDCGRDLLFDFRNLNAECSKCNAFDETHLLGYAEGLDRRYGYGTAQELRRRRDEHLAGPLVKDWKATEYADKILDLKAMTHHIYYPQEQYEDVHN